MNKENLNIEKIKKYVVNNKKNPLFIISVLIIVLILLIFIIRGFFKPDIIGTWQHEYNGDLVNLGRKYEFLKGGKANYYQGLSFNYYEEDDAEVTRKCTYKFNFTYSKIKIKCKADGEYKGNNEWYSFSKDNENIYIDHEKYEHY